jgi:predicted AAA+ superfamily ATPase
VIDEATALTGWRRIVKKLRDDGALGRLCVLVTGSSSHDLKAGSERLAGRRGPASLPDQILLPMSFPEFLRQAGLAGLSPSPADAMRAYLDVGGFPFRVDEYLRAAARKGKPSSPRGDRGGEAEGATEEYDPLRSLQVFDDVVFYEFLRRRLDRSIALEVLGRLATVLTGATSYEAFSKPLTLSRDTAHKYLDVLGDAFLLATISSYDTGRPPASCEHDRRRYPRVAPKKDRKLAWIDPSLGFLAAWLRQGEVAPIAARAEWLVGATLLREFESRLWEGLSSPRNVFTWRSKAGNEVDYLVVDRSRRLLFPVEVKHQRTIADWDFQVMERAFGKGLMVTAGAERERAKSRAVALKSFLTEPRGLVR